MSRLVQGMYSNPARQELFGLHAGQIRYRRDLVHNGGWYNEHGEKLGWGDLSAKDMNRISAELENDELFIVLDEASSYWNFVTFSKRRPRMLSVSEAEQSPGIEYLATKWRYIIAPGTVYAPISGISNYDPAKWLIQQGVKNAVTISRAEARKRLR